MADLCSQLVAGRAVDAGPLESARWLETLTAVLLNVNRRYRRNTGIRITGLSAWGNPWFPHGPPP